jgi:hypothetical protein
LKDFFRIPDLNGLQELDDPQDSEDLDVLQDFMITPTWRKETDIRREGDRNGA